LAKTYLCEESLINDFVRRIKCFIALSGTPLRFRMRTERGCCW